MFSSWGQFASTSQFYLFGKRYFTKTGWENAAAKYPKPDLLSDDLDLSGKVYLITGGNAGIGREIVNFVSKHGASVFIVCRSKERGEAAVAEISAASNNSNIFLLVGDCGLQCDVRRIWNEFTSHPLHNNEVTLHGLVCNAGSMSHEYTTTAEGVETTFATHLLFGTYLLTSLAIPILQTTSNSRVILVSSGGMYNTKFPAWEVATSLSGAYNGQMVYSYCKRAQVLLAEEWTKRYSEVKFVSCHPGWTETPGLNAAYGGQKRYFEPLRSLYQGAEGIIWLLCASWDQLEGGAFYLDRSPCVKHIAGPFFSEGSFTKNTSKEIEEMMTQLDAWSAMSHYPRRNCVALQPVSTAIPAYQLEGSWFVVSFLPSFFDKNSMNNTFELSFQQDGLHVSYKYLSHNTTTESEVKHVALTNDANTVWTVAGAEQQPGTTYYILHYDKDGIVLATADGGSVWVLSRVQSVPADVYEEMTAVVVKYGFDASSLTRAKHFASDVYSLIENIVADNALKQRAVSMDRYSVDANLVFSSYQNKEQKIVKLFQSMTAEEQARVMQKLTAVKEKNEV